MAAKGKSATTTRYRFLGDHATELELGSGVVLQVGPGDFVDLAAADYAAIDPEQMAYLLDTSAAQPTEEEVAAVMSAPAAPAEEVTTNDK